MIDVIKEVVENAYALGEQIATTCLATPHYDTDFHTACNRASHDTIAMKCFDATCEKYDKFTGYHLIALWSDAFRMGVDKVQVVRRQEEPRPYRTHTPTRRSTPPLTDTLPPSSIIQI